jgi:hypothetical protein
MATENPLNEAQRRRIFSNAQYADKLLSDVEAILSASESKSIFPKYVADLSPPQVKLIRSYITRPGAVAAASGRYFMGSKCLVPISRPELLDRYRRPAS